MAKDRLARSSELLSSVLQARRINHVPQDIASEFGLPFGKPFGDKDVQEALISMPKPTRLRLIQHSETELELLREAATTAAT
jgi:hypothetical protein